MECSITYTVTYIGLILKPKMNIFATGSSAYLYEEGMGYSVISGSDMAFTKVSILLSQDYFKF